MKQTTKRFISMIAGLAFLVSSLVVYFQLIQPAYEDTKNIKAQQLSQQSFLDSEKTVVKQVQDLIASYEGQLQIQQAVSAALPPNPDIVGALAQLYGLAQENNLVVQSISVGFSGESGSGVGQFSLKKPIGTINFQLSLVGTYESFKTFLSMLETNIRILDLKSLSLQPPSAPAGKSAPDLYNYGLTVSAYYQIGG
jgi:Tfp pilus assembly protein PilO